VKEAKLSKLTTRELQAMQKEVFSKIAAHNKRVMECFDKWLADRKK
jgi:hypothetical protein